MKPFYSATLHTLDLSQVHKKFYFGLLLRLGAIVYTRTSHTIAARIASPVSNTSLLTLMLHPPLCYCTIRTMWQGLQVCEELKELGALTTRLLGVLTYNTVKEAADQFNTPMPHIESITQQIVPKKPESFEYVTTNED